MSRPSGPRNSGVEPGVIPAHERGCEVPRVHDSGGPPPPAGTSGPAAARGDGPSDLELVEASRRGDLQAFERLVVRYEARVRRLAFAFVRDESLAEDVAQDTFLQALRRINSLKKATSVRSWLFSIAVNRARDELRRRARWVPGDFGLDAEKGPVATDASGEDRVLQLQLRGHLQQVIAELPDRYRVPLLLKDVEGMTYVEIGRMLGIPMGTAQIRIHRARLRLRESLRRRGLVAGREAREQA
jgi:RNA polymerase sigma-70 factor (ECF subfamily)